MERLVQGGEASAPRLRRRETPGGPSGSEHRSSPCELAVDAEVGAHRGKGDASNFVCAC